MLNANTPLIQSLDDLMTEEEVIKFFGITRTALQGWRYGREGRPKLPYVRLVTNRWYSKTQVVWWLNQWQMKVIDKYHVDRMRRLEKGIVVGRPKQRNPQSV